MIAVLAGLLFVSQAKHATFLVAGVQREALVVYPTASENKKSPVIFAFHGHGGNMNYAERTYNLERYWPEAIVVYMQGLPTKGMTDPQGVKNGWQQRVGDGDNRDVKFFDAVLNSLEGQGTVDESQIYVMGHSNGGAFSYVLWATHPGLFAAVGSAAGFFRPTGDVRPAPLIHIAGKQDGVVPYRIQAWTVKQMRQIDGCVSDGHEWTEPGCTIWDSTSGNPVVLCSYDGGHTYPSDASAKFIEFFRQHRKN